MYQIRIITDHCDSKKNWIKFWIGVKSNDDKKIELNLLIKYKFEKKIINIFFALWSTRKKSKCNKNWREKQNSKIQWLYNDNFGKKFKRWSCVWKKISNQILSNQKNSQFSFAANFFDENATTMNLPVKKRIQNSNLRAQIVQIGKIDIEKHAIMATIKKIYSWFLKRQEIFKSKRFTFVKIKK